MLGSEFRVAIISDDRRAPNRRELLQDCDVVIWGSVRLGRLDVPDTVHQVECVMLSHDLVRRDRMLDLVGMRLSRGGARVRAAPALTALEPEGPLRVRVVTGSRDGTRQLGELKRALADADLVLHGAAPGVDRQAHRIALRQRTLELPCPALWHRYLDAAGKMRNNVLARIAAHLMYGGADVQYFAFPSSRSRGTWDAVNQLKQFEVPGRVIQGEKQ